MTPVAYNRSWSFLAELAWDGDERRALAAVGAAGAELDQWSAVAKFRRARKHAARENRKAGYDVEPVSESDLLLVDRLPPRARDFARSVPRALSYLIGAFKRQAAAERELGEDRGDGTRFIPLNDAPHEAFGQVPHEGDAADDQRQRGWNGRGLSPDGVHWEHEVGARSVFSAMPPDPAQWGGPT